MYRQAAVNERSSAVMQYLLISLAGFCTNQDQHTFGVPTAYVITTKHVQGWGRGRVGDVEKSYPISAERAMLLLSYVSHVCDTAYEIVSEYKDSFLMDDENSVGDVIVQIPRHYYYRQLTSSYSLLTPLVVQTTRSYSLQVTVRSRVSM